MTIAERITRAKADYDEVYDTGYAKGKSEGGGTGSGAVKISSNQASLQAAFQRMSFSTDELELTANSCTNLQYTFYQMLGAKKITLVIESENKVSATNAFGYAKETEIIDLSRCVAKFTDVGYMFSQTFGLVKILGELDLSECTKIGQWLIGATNLEEIRLKEETLSVYPVDCGECVKLSRASLKSIVAGLFGPVDNMLVPTITLSLKAVNKAFEETEGANDGSTSYDWLVGCVDTRYNWTVSLI